MSDSEADPSRQSDPKKAKRKAKKAAAAVSPK
jgi:hypothetical protein